ncbi:hypothetical protein [Antarctobacter sp.]|uniref:hypothetical protein n=1 Tax=Antarctobacter sp. TaxID=1872577 RepID=UPI003A9440C1
MPQIGHGDRVERHIDFGTWTVPVDKCLERGARNVCLWPLEIMPKRLPFGEPGFDTWLPVILSTTGTP